MALIYKSKLLTNSHKNTLRDVVITGNYGRRLDRIFENGEELANAAMDYLFCCYLNYRKKHDITIYTWENGKAREFCKNVESWLRATMEKEEFFGYKVYMKKYLNDI